MKFLLFESLIDDKSNISKDTKFAIKVGILPVMLFSAKSNSFRRLKEPINVGTVPVKEFP